jgi:uncharacterized protein involved in outer membrane biogenesis
MKKWFLYGATGFIAVIAIAAFFLPKIIDGEAKKIANEQFGLTLSYDKFEFSLSKPSLAIRGLKLLDANSSQPLLSFKSLTVEPSYASIAKMYPIIDAVTLDEPNIKIEKDANGKFNFEKHLPPKKPSEAKSKESLFELREFHVKNGTLSFKDGALGLDEKIEKIDIDGFGISNTTEGKAKYAEVNSSVSVFGGRIAKQTKIKPFDSSLPFEQRLQISGIELGKFARFLPKDIKKLEGKISVDANISGQLAKTIKMRSSGKIALNKLAFEGFETSVNAEQLWLDGISFEANKSAKLDGFVVKNLSVVKKSAGIDAKIPKLELKELGISLADKNHELSVGEFGIENSHVLYRTKGLPKELTIEAGDINLKITNIQPTKDVTSQLTALATLEKTGKISLKGDINILKKSANLSVEASGIPLKPVDSLGVLPPKLSLASGLAYAKGSLGALFDGKNKQVTYKGQVGVQKFALFENATNQKIVGFDTMGVNGIDFSLEGRKAVVASITFEGLFADIKIDKQKRLNLMSFSEKNSTESNATEVVAAPAQKPFYYSIGSVVLQNGSLKFEDEHIKPNYKASLTKVSGRVTTIKPNMDELSNIALIGTFNNQGQIDIKGSFIPNPKNFYLSVKSDVRDIGLSSFTTYSSKYIGYEIESGALGLELDYQIVGRELSSNNKISLFSFNLGDEVESPSAKKLPYKLALAILKDSKGNIDIELPVEGTTDDPDIRSGKVIWKFISQLITKVITAPFKFIGSLFGGGDEMGFVEFGFGSAEIAKKEEAKLGKIADMMKQKVGLKVEIEGFVDGEMDSEALKNLAFHKKLAIQKLKDLKKSEKDWQKTVIEPLEYEKYLLKAYKAEAFAKPSNFLGFEKNIPLEDMKNLILTHIQITEQNMMELAKRRAEVTKKALEALGIEAARITISQTKLGAPEQKEKVKNSRIEMKFGLK